MRQTSWHPGRKSDSSVLLINRTVYASEDIHAYLMSHTKAILSTLRIQWATPGDCESLLRVFVQRVQGKAVVRLPRPRAYTTAFAFGFIGTTEYLTAQFDLANGYLPRLTAANADGEPAIRIGRGKLARVHNNTTTTTDNNNT